MDPYICNFSPYLSTHSDSGMNTTNRSCSERDLTSRNLLYSLDERLTNAATTTSSHTGILQVILRNTLCLPEQFAKLAITPTTSDDGNDSEKAVRSAYQRNLLSDVGPPVSTPSWAATGTSGPQLASFSVVGSTEVSARSTHIQHENDRQRTDCGCRKRLYRTRATSWLKGFIWVSAEESSTHAKSCPFYNGSHTSKAIVLRVPWQRLTQSMSHYTTLALSTSKSGYPLYPKLRYHRVVSWDSPAFALFRHERLERIFDVTETTSVNAGDLIADSLTALKRVYQEGKALPTDQDEYGHNILHVCTLWQTWCIAYKSQWVFWSLYMTRQLGDGGLAEDGKMEPHLFRRIFSELQGAGVPINETATER